MKPIKLLPVAALALLPLGLYAIAQGTSTDSRAPTDIAKAAPAVDWVDIPEKDLLLMKTADGGRIVIQLATDFAPIHIANIRKLAALRWWDGLSIYRVQDNYAVQWGDVTEKKALPADVIAVPPAEYVRSVEGAAPRWIDWPDPYAKKTGFLNGWPVGGDDQSLWLTHCYAMVGVARNLAPDTGSGAELYTIVGHAPRHLDRNIALVGRVIEGIEFLASRPRGTEALGFYGDARQRIAIDSVVSMSEASAADKVRYQYLAGDSFTAYEAARANRRDPFFEIPAGGADVCNIPVPIRKKP